MVCLWNAINDGDGQIHSERAQEAFMSSRELRVLFPVVSLSMSMVVNVQNILAVSALILLSSHVEQD